MEMTWQCHPEVELPSFVTVEAHEALYAPRGVERVEIDLDKAAEQFYRGVGDQSELTPQEVRQYIDARAAEKAAKSSRKPGEKAGEKAAESTSKGS